MPNRRDMRQQVIALVEAGYGARSAGRLVGVSGVQPSWVHRYQNSGQVENRPIPGQEDSNGKKSTHDWRGGLKWKRRTPRERRTKWKRRINREEEDITEEVVSSRKGTHQEEEDSSRKRWTTRKRGTNTEGETIKEGTRALVYMYGERAPTRGDPRLGPPLVRTAPSARVMGVCVYNGSHARRPPVPRETLFRARAPAGLSPLAKGPHETSAPLADALDGGLGETGPRAGEGVSRAHGGPRRAGFHGKGGLDTQEEDSHARGGFWQEGDDTQERAHMQEEGLTRKRGT
ncbi:hypothetical protein ANN_16125 [Periplaneta americana]|uniref:Uncharacterized protein n=1 Tax=Periplaneta americana TaxID=6978 RepID=A0ABQ8SI35_PERAM|nr:hypothetical protein ANN_16125 [Periplaneta americana]